MKKPSIAFYQEQKPAHFVGADISITLKRKANIEKWKIDAVENMLLTILQNCNYEEIETSEGLVT